MKKKAFFPARTAYWSLFIMVLMVSMAIAVVGSSRKIRIMPIGDSITDGLGHPSYRYWLWQSLVAAGFGDNTEFVGPATSCNDTVVWPCNHAATSGYTTGNWIYDGPSILAVDTPDVALVHLGTNNISGETPTSLDTALAQMESLIDMLRVYNPHVTILLCKIIPGLYYNGEYITYNNALASIAAARTLPESPIIMVDQYTGFNVGSDLRDYAHPNTNGDQKIAGKFLDSLLPVLNKLNGVHAAFEETINANRLSAGGSVHLEAWASAYPAVKDVVFIGNGSVVPGIKVYDSLYECHVTLPLAGSGSGLMYSVRAVVSNFSGRSDTSDEITLGVPRNVTTVPPSLSDIPEYSIPVVQGETETSPYANCVVLATGVVTAVTRDLTGFWMQDTLGDNNDNTSDAIYVVNKRSMGVTKGDVVTVNGMVEEYEQVPGKGSTTRLRCFPNLAPDIRGILSHNHPLPAPQAPGWLPNQDVEQMRKLYSSHEGMLTRWTMVPAVAPSGAWGVISSGNFNPGSSGFYWPPSLTINEPRGPNIVDYNPETVLIGSKALIAPRVRCGDTVFSLTGVVDYDKGMYYIQPLPDSLHVSAHASAPSSPVGKRNSSAGSLRITSFDLGGYFDSLDTWGKSDVITSGADYTLKLNKTAMAISQELLKPAILCVQNIDNSNSLADIAATVNTLYGGKYKIAAARKYVADFWVDTPATFSPQGLINGFLYDSTVFHLSSAFLMSGPAIDSSFGRLSAIPTAQPLVGAFTIAGSTLAIVNVTLADKGRDDPLYVKTWPVAENSKAVRAKQARAVRTWMNATLTSVPGLYLLVVGEFNDYPFAEPLDGSECPVSIVAGHAAKGETVLYNAYDYLAPDTRYTCITAGRAQMTAQLMVSPSLAPLAKAVDALHFNAAFEEELGSDATTPVRCSRHDAVEIRF